MELCHIDDVQLKSRLTNSADHLEPIAPDCGIYHLQPYQLYGMHLLCFFTISGNYVRCREEWTC